MALSCCTAVAIASPSFTFHGSPAFLPSLSSSLLVHRIPKWRSRASYTGPGARLSQSHFTDRSDFQWRYHGQLTPRAYETGTTTEEGLTLEDVKEPELDGGGVNGGGGRGDENGGSGGGGRGDGGGESREGDGANKKKKSGLSMSQKLTLAYAILVGVGGIMGFAKSGSSKSLMAGGGSASILYYVFLNLPSNPVLASTIGLGVSGLLLFIMGSRYMESGKVFPAGVVSLFSLVMSGGYVHGIMRTSHT